MTDCDLTELHPLIEQSRLRLRAGIARIERPPFQPEAVERMLADTFPAEPVESLEPRVDASVELLERLAADWAEIKGTFFPAGHPGTLTSVDGGRAVRILGFPCGARLVYKPRPLAADAHFQELLAWINAGSGLPPFRTVRVMDRGSYGWMEHVAAAPCAGEAEAALYHRRLGGLLALLYAVEATGCHSESLIAAGSQPVVVNLGSLFHPCKGRSVLHIGLLPAGASAEETAAGFRDVYRLLIRRREELLAPGGPIARFSGDPVRLWIGTGGQPAIACPSSVDVWTSRGERIAGFFSEPSFLAVQRRIAGLDEADLERQAALIRRSPGAAPRDEKSPVPEAGLRERLIAGFRSLGNRLASLAVRCVG